MLAFLACLLIITQTACGKKAGQSAEPVTLQSYYFDTVCSISIYDMDDMSQKNAEAVIRKAFKQCARYEDLLSKTKKGTDIYKINHAGGKPVKVDPITTKIIKKGIHYGDISDGAFDITIGKVADLWNFTSDEEKDHKIPSRAALREALKYVDYKQISVKGNTVQMGTSKGEIDLGGIAKGYIGDMLYDYLKEQKVTSAIISLGGNIVCVADKAGQPCKIGIEKPFTQMQETVGYTEMSDKTAVTSGIYERYFKKNGKIYHHILSVKTGMPIDNDICGITIIGEAGHSVDCDALSTISLIEGTDKALKMIDKMDGYEALSIKRNGKLSHTSGMDFTEEQD